MSDISSSYDGATAPPVRSASVGRTGVRVWDLPTRLLHWALLACVAGAVASAQLGGNWMDWHVRLGAGTIGLLLFRLIWGFIGPRYARFRSFLHAPRVVLAHLKSLHRPTRRHAGHSPSGGASVFAMLGVLAALALTGLLSSDTISIEGALVRFASESTVSLATSIHVKLQWVIYVLVALHVAAVLAYLVVKKQDLIRPMVQGDMRGVRAPHAADTTVVRVVGLSLMLLSVAGSVALLGG